MPFAPRSPRSRSHHGSTADQARRLAVVTMLCLILVTAYSVALGSNGWLWFGWTMLLAISAALFAFKE